MAVAGFVPVLRLVLEVLVDFPGLLLLLLAEDYLVPHRARPEVDHGLCVHAAGGFLEVLVEDAVGGELARLPGAQVAEDQHQGGDYDVEGVQVDEGGQVEEQEPEGDLGV